ncbi:MAG: PDZ domain-containing protein [Myxococcaceae bacterium]|nr:PDZ domain-containing protein [Myxococcaceae bacterium]
MQSLFLWALLFLAGPAHDSHTELPIFNRAMLQIKEQYVQPTRIEPKKMLLGALEAMQREIPEFMYRELSLNEIEIQIVDRTETWKTDLIQSLWDLSFFMRDIFRFIEPSLPKSVDRAEVEYAAVNGSLSRLDPHSVLLEPKFSKEMKLSTKGEFGGLGIVVGLRDGVLSVISPLEGTPADRAGLKALDRILRIDESSTVNLALDEAVDKLRGQPGTAVTLLVQGHGESSHRRVTIIRDRIKVDSISSHKIDKKIGYVKIKAFHSNTASDLKSAIDALGSIKGLILDFRNNPGGLLNESVAVSDLFLDGGVVVVTQGSKAFQRQEEKASSGSSKTEFPMVVLVNSGSASASEIVAGALKNRNRALILGEQTFGKGSVQMLYDFPDQSSLKLTIAQYLTPGDESIQSVGITPDILLQPAYLENKRHVILFPLARIREEDLDSHLDNKTRVRQSQPAYTLTYLTQRLGLEEAQRRAVSSQFHEDFEISLAKRLLLSAEGASRTSLLSSAKSVVAEVQLEESKRIQSDLAKLGVNWEPPSVPSSANVMLRVIGASKAKAGSVLRITLEAKNLGKEPAYQVYGISKSSTSLFAEREFIFGKLDVGQSKRWQSEISIPKDVLPRHDAMKVCLHTNHVQTHRCTNVPIDIQGLPKPILAFSYQIQPTKENSRSKVKVLVRNTGLGASMEPMVLLKNKKKSDLFIEEGRAKLGVLKPGQMKEVVLAFHSEASADARSALQLQIFDAASGEYWLEDLNLESTQWVKKTPPQVRWLDSVRTTSQDIYRLRAQVQGKPNLKDVYVYVGDQKILYKASEGKKEIVIDQMVKLKPGANTVTLFARDGESFGQRESQVIYSRVGDSLAKNP